MKRIASALILAAALISLFVISAYLGSGIIAANLDGLGIDCTSIAIANKTTTTCTLLQGVR